MKKINIVLFEDNTPLRESLSLLLHGTPQFCVVGSFKNCNNVVAEVERLKPDVILMDIDLPGINGIRAVQMIREKNALVRILMLTVFDDDKNIFKAICSGANGYLLKETSPVKLIEYIIDVYNGGAPMTSSIATQVLQMFADKNLVTNNDYVLSEREKEVLQLLVKGFSYKLIANELFISIDTVRSYIKRIYEKLQVNSKSEAVAKAFRDKIV